MRYLFFLFLASITVPVQGKNLIDRLFPIPTGEWDFVRQLLPYELDTTAEQRQTLRTQVISAKMILIGGDLAGPLARAWPRQQPTPLVLDQWGLYRLMPLLLEILNSSEHRPLIIISAGLQELEEPKMLGNITWESPWWYRWWSYGQRPWARWIYSTLAVLKIYPLIINQLRPQAPFMLNEEVLRQLTSAPKPRSEQLLHYHRQLQLMHLLLAPLAQLYQNQPWKIAVVGPTFTVDDCEKPLPDKPSNSTIIRQLNSCGDGAFSAMLHLYLQRWSQDGGFSFFNTSDYLATSQDLSSVAQLLVNQALAKKKLM